jgi:hypothetical protein
MEMSWPQGQYGSTQISGRGRDIFSGDPARSPQVLAEASLSARVSPAKIIEQIHTTPALPGLNRVIGAHAVVGFRGKLRDSVDLEALGGGSLIVLLDDLVGCNVISAGVWMRWPSGQAAKAHKTAERRQSMEGVCIGFRTGSVALASGHVEQAMATVPPLTHPDDPEGFHALWPDVGISLRRARRIDIWHANDGTVHVDTMFQDSCTVPTGRDAFHEYCLTATIDPVRKRLITICADPRVLPYPECLGAPANLGIVEGTPLRDLRSIVLQRLRGTLGCTHLNDATRALAEVPDLINALDARI